MTDAAPGGVDARVMGVGLDWFKVSRTDNVQSGDTLTAGGDTFLLAVGVVRGWTADALEVDVTVTVCKQDKVDS